MQESRAHQSGNGPLSMLDERGRPLVTPPASFTGGEVEILRGALARQQYERTGDAVPAYRP